MIRKVKKNMLKEIVFNKNLSWDSDLGGYPEKFVVEFSFEVINELRSNATNLHEKCKSNFPLLVDSIESFKSKKIINGVGIFIIKGCNFYDFSKDQIKNIYEIISSILGELLEQDANGSKIITIKDKGKLLSSGGRYHQTSDGGSYHTDAPHWITPPDILGMWCINPALEGGVSKFISGYTIHNEVLKRSGESLRLLYGDFLFDRREEVAKDLRVISKPIFSFKKNNLYCRFLKDYIISGHKIKGVHLSDVQITSLNLLGDISNDSKYSLNYNLKTNDMVFFDNHRIFHGRTAFKDFSDGDKKREMLRVWIKTSPQ
jgi:hypothetical protein